MAPSSPKHRTTTPVRTATLLVMVANLAAGHTAEAQEIVYDPTAYTKILEQSQTALQQLDQLKGQLTQAQQLYRSLNTGSAVNALASGLEAPALRGVVPDVAAFLNAAQAGASAVDPLAARAAQIRAATRLYTPAGPDPASQALETSGDRAARDLALAETVTDAGAQRGVGLEQLQDAVGAAGDARAVLDLQARLAAEQALTANDQMRLQALAMAQAAEDHLQAQQDRERRAAADAARLAAYQAGFR